MQRFDERPEPSRVMSEAEAQEVLRLQVARSGGLPEVSAAELAHTLGISEREVGDLLDEVRANRKLSMEAKPRRRVKARDILLACIAAILFIVAASQLINFVSTPRAKGPVETGFSYHIAGTGVSIDVPSKIPLSKAESNEALINTMAEKADRVLTTPPVSSFVSTQQSLPSASDLLKQLKAGNWDAPGIEHQSITVQDQGLTTNTSLPYYQGSDQDILRACQIERQNRIKWALHDLARQASISP